MSDKIVNHVNDMATAEVLICNNMQQEAKERMELLRVSSDDINRFFVYKEITKIVVDHENMRVCKQTLTDEEKEVIRQLEREKEYLVYYMIQDEGIWPDGCSFPRYTILYVDKYMEEYMHVKEYIQTCEIVPAYVINQEEPECSEITEIGFRNVSGLIINVT